MDEVDRGILNIIQDEFPLNKQPFKVIAERLGISEKEVLQRIEQLRNTGIIKRIRATFNPWKLNYKSTLVAIKVPEEKLKEVVDVINEIKGVTHNYKRNHEYNLWFTLIAEDNIKIKNILNDLKQKTKIKDMIRLDSVKTFKLKLKFAV
ncbi:MAG: AsnC family transcriptional regulator [bacterium]|nr:AsnC family transcriptional regulator [bacterium]